jgi:hypothetical protein
VTVNGHLGSGVGLCLPRSAVLTELLTEPSDSSVSGDEIGEIRAILISELQDLTDELMGMERLRVDVHDVVRALEKPERRGDEQAAFTHSPRRSRRAIGIAAVQRCVRGRSAAPHSAVGEVLVSALEDVEVQARCETAPRAAWWAEWYSVLEFGARRSRPRRSRGGDLGDTALDCTGVESPGQAGGPRRARRLVGLPG